MNDHRLMQIILAPIVTEKATFVAEKNNQVAFRVVADATKPEIHDAIEAIWGVKVLKVNTLNRKGKFQRTRNSNRIGQRPSTKRAIVTLAAGSKIPLFES